jgi:hypothetical protein
VPNASLAPPPPPASTTSSNPPPTDSEFSLPGIGAVSSVTGAAPVSGPGAISTPSSGGFTNATFAGSRLPFHIVATLAEVYDNNIFVQPHKTYDYVTRLSARGELQLGNIEAPDGNYLDVFYKPTGHLYALHPHEDGVDQEAELLYEHHFTRLTLSLKQTYTSTQETNASIGNLVTGDVYITNIGADYAYSSKIDLVGSLNQNFTSYDNPVYTDTKEWSGDFHALYHIDDKLSVGVGPTVGYLNVEDAPDQTFQQLLGRVNYNPSDKLTFKGAAGVEDREYQTSSRSDTIEPIFEFSGSYLPNPSTILSVSSSRRFRPSYNLIGQDYLATNVNLSATQRFFDEFYLGLVGGYENDDYELESSGEGGTTREDNYFFIAPSLNWVASGWLQVSTFAKYEEDDSNFAVFTYNSTQFGISTSLIY